MNVLIFIDWQDHFFGWSWRQAVAASWSCFRCQLKGSERIKERRSESLAILRIIDYPFPRRTNVTYGIFRTLKSECSSRRLTRPQCSFQSLCKQNSSNPFQQLEIPQSTSICHASKRTKPKARIACSTDREVEWIFSICLHSWDGGNSKANIIYLELLRSKLAFFLLNFYDTNSSMNLSTYYYRITVHVDLQKSFAIVCANSLVPGQQQRQIIRGMQNRWKPSKLLSGFSCTHETKLCAK